MKLLAVETATEACSAALYIDGEIEERYQLAPREHTRLILPMIDSLMADAGLTPPELDALAFGCGPGSFTGVRIATGVIHGIALGADLPVVPVSTLAAIAQDCFDKTDADVVFSAIDARMNEIFWGIYQRSNQDIAELLGHESVGPACELAVIASVGIGYGAGSGWKIYEDDLLAKMKDKVAKVEPDYLPRASAVVRLGADGYQKNKAVSVEQAMPVYLRNNVARKPGE